MADQTNQNQPPSPQQQAQGTGHHQQLTAAGCPDHVARKLAAGAPHVQALPPGFWLDLAKKFGPVVWQILEAIINAQHQPTPAP